MTRPEPDERTPLRPANPIHPKILTAWRVGAAAGALAATIAALVAFALSGLPSLPVIAVPVVGAALVVWLPGALYARWRYEIRERDVFLAHGLLQYRLVLVPFDRIQFVETQQGPLDRWFDMMQVKIHTAGGSESIPGLVPAEAERIREELSRVAGTSSV